MCTVSILSQTKTKRLCQLSSNAIQLSSQMKKPQTSSKARVASKSTKLKIAIQCPTNSTNWSGSFSPRILSRDSAARTSSTNSSIISISRPTEVRRAARLNWLSQFRQLKQTERSSVLTRATDSYGYLEPTVTCEFMCYLLAVVYFVA